MKIKNFIQTVRKKKNKKQKKTDKIQPQANRHQSLCIFIISSISFLRILAFEY